MGLRVKQTLLGVASNRLELFGFKYNEVKSNSSLWVFSRHAEGVEEFFEFQRSVHQKNAISLFIQTTKDPVGIYGATLAGKKDSPWWQYHDQETLRAVLDEIVTIASEQGLLYLEYVRHPYPVVPTDAKRRLLDNPARRALLLKNNFQFGEDPFEIVRDLEQIVLGERNKGTDIDWDFLLTVAAYYGELIRSTLSGEWLWDEQDAIPYILVTGANRRDKINPIDPVVRFWWNPFRSMTSAYKRITAL